MKQFIINNKGLENFKIGKKRIFQHIITYPIFIPLITFLFILGSKNKGMFYFSIILSILFSFYMLSIIILMIRKTNHIINFIKIDNENVCIKTFGWFLLKEKVISFNLKELKIRPHKFRITEKIEEEGWKLNINGKDYSLIKNFFDGDVESILRNSYTTPLPPESFRAVK